MPATLSNRLPGCTKLELASPGYLRLAYPPSDHGIVVACFNLLSITRESTAQRLNAGLRVPLFFGIAVPVTLAAGKISFVVLPQELEKAVQGAFGELFDSARKVMLYEIKLDPCCLTILFLFLTVSVNQCIHGGLYHTSAEQVVLRFDSASLQLVPAFVVRFQLRTPNALLRIYM